MNEEKIELTQAQSNYFNFLNELDLFIAFSLELYFDDTALDNKQSISKPFKLTKGFIIIHKYKSDIMPHIAKEVGTLGIRIFVDYLNKNYNGSYEKYREKIIGKETLNRYEELLRKFNDKN